MQLIINPLTANHLAGSVCMYVHMCHVKNHTKIQKQNKLIQVLLTVFTENWPRATIRLHSTEYPAMTLLVLAFQAELGESNAPAHIIIDPIIMHIPTPHTINYFLKSISL